MRYVPAQLLECSTPVHEYISTPLLVHAHYPGNVPGTSEPGTDLLIASPHPVLERGTDRKTHATHRLTTPHEGFKGW